MANYIMTRQETVEAFRDTAREAVAKLPMDSLKRLAQKTSFPIGITGGILAFMALAAQERLMACKNS